MTRIACCVLTFVALTTSAAFAQAGPAVRPRLVAAGLGFGVGAQTWGSYDSGIGDRDNHLLASLGSLEIAGFVDDHFSIDVSIAAPWFAVWAATDGTLALSGSVFLDWGFGDQHRFLIGPGLGASGHTNDRAAPFPADAGVELRVASIVGYEFIADDRFFLRIVTRPWLSFGGGAQGSQIGGGAMLEVLFFFYGT